ncbi:MAG: hypothetical protein ACP5OG_03565 [Candidatus Nanoarchaeia archaeon]
MITNASVFADIIISEVELNPQGEDRGNEWLELYSDEPASVKGWRIENHKGKNITLDFSFSGYKIVEAPYNFLVNENCKITLYNNDKKVFETDILKDSSNDERTNSYCNGEWVFSTSTKAKENSCSQENEDNNEDDEDEDEDEKESAKEERDEDENQEAEENEKYSIESVLESKEKDEEDLEKNMEINQTLYLGKKSQKIESSLEYNQESESIKSRQNIIYESLDEKIKKQAIYWFALFELFLIFLLLFERIKLKNGRQNTGIFNI